MPAAVAAAVVAKGLSPISSSITLLPLAANFLASANTVKAVSAVTELAKLLYEGMVFSHRVFEPEKLLRNNNYCAILQQALNRSSGEKAQAFSAGVESLE